jgi:large subunit ribosomal protein L10
MATDNAARAHKAAVIDEVKTRMGGATASIVSEYRGLSVAELANLRASLAAAGGDYKIFKNTLVLRAIDGSDYQPLGEYLSGPSALTFVDGDVSAVAKALRDFARANPLLVIKGGLADGSLLSSADLAALADLPSREVLLARLAGALAAPMQQMAGLLQALPRNLAYGLSALIEQRQAGGEVLPEAAAPDSEAAAPESEAAAVAESDEDVLLETKQDGLVTEKVSPEDGPEGAAAEPAEVEEPEAEPAEEVVAEAPEEAPATEAPATEAQATEAQAAEAPGEEPPADEPPADEASE